MDRFRFEIRRRIIYPALREIPQFPIMSPRRLDAWTSKLLRATHPRRCSNEATPREFGPERYLGINGSDWKRGSLLLLQEVLLRADLLHVQLRAGLLFVLRTHIRLLHTAVLLPTGSLLCASARLLCPRGNAARL